MSKQLSPKYNPAEVEAGRYQKWLNEDVFKPSGDKKAHPYSIVIPPPNVTGKLHLGHAWDTTLQDIIIRQKRMQGFDTLWLPGMDHAGIATQAKVEARLAEDGISRYDLGREKFLDKVWEWKDEYAATIKEQWGKMGISVDYSRERFTLDEGLSKAVRKVFVELYKKGWIYRGEFIINWDPKARTALSDIEVIHKDVEGAFYHMNYMLEDGSRALEVATTRPETMFGDTAVAVNPNDDRYKDLIGKNVILPIVNKPIPIVSDEHADPEFGTGVVKITPAHDPNDFLVGQRHNLPQVNVMNDDGTMNDLAGEFSGMDRFEARKATVKKLEEIGALVKIEKRVHSVGHSERTGVMVEPRLSTQWFVKMDQLAKNAIANQDTDDKVKFYPPRFNDTFLQWMENVHDWVISRQLWWGHQIPAWYNADGEIYVGEEAPEGDDWMQDPDVLDTWFSSALWPFSTMGWPDVESADFKRYYPTSTLVTGYDIIPFWVSRMIFQGLEFTGKSPFKNALIHGLIRDEQGRKMSKSLGNGIDPMDVIEKYGTDSLRWFLSNGSAPGQDVRFSYEKMDAAWNFINKVWNISRYILMNNESLSLDQASANVEKVVAGTAVKASPDHPVLVDSYLVGSECEVDAISDGKDVLIPGIMEHIERAGVHSGDSMAVYPPQTLSKEVQATIADYTKRLAIGLNCIGMMNIQFVIKDETVYVIEVNPRASRTVPFLSKVTDIPMAQIATKLILGSSLTELGYKDGLYPESQTVHVKAPVFSFTKLAKVDSLLGPEMKSTGEVMGTDSTLEKALYKAFEASYFHLPAFGNVIFTIADDTKEEALALARRFSNIGYSILATEGTAKFFKENGIQAQLVEKIGTDDHNDIPAFIRKGKVQAIINTVGTKRTADEHGQAIRHSAIVHGIPLFTALDTANAMLQVLESRSFMTEAI